MMRVTATVGRKNSGPPKPVVMLNSSDDGSLDDWLTPTQARAFAKKLISAAEAAEQRYEEWKAKKLSPAPKPKGARP